MGRSYRKRRRKRICCRSIGLGGENSFIRFFHWLSENGWNPTTNLNVAEFPDTGRGIITKDIIRNGDIIVKIPLDMLITINTVCVSKIGNLFISDKEWDNQQVLSVFLLWEKHLSSESFWHTYIEILPTEYASPLFESETNISKFPSVIANRALDSKLKIKKYYLEILELCSGLICVHCGQEYNHIFSEDAFLWSWFTVNSRSVYISPLQNKKHAIQLLTEDCLALAPYLDLFNHSNTAKVEAEVIDDLYQLRTLVPFKKCDQVFIHYGGHSNLVLFLDYGFIISNNSNDTIPITFEDIIFSMRGCFPSESRCSREKYQFLSTHKLLNDLYFGSEGYSWSAKAVITILLLPEDTRSFYDATFNKNKYDFNIPLMIIGKSLHVWKYTAIEKEIELLQTVPGEASALAVKFLNEQCKILDNFVQTLILLSIKE